MNNEFQNHPLDPGSAERLAAGGLRLELLDRTDRERRDAWFRADSRGFLGARPTPEAVEQSFSYRAGHRVTGVWDDSSVNGELPVATTESWVAELSVPGERTVPAWAISSVTVAPSHRRRGIAAALIGAELRTARALEVPLAVLTVSEATIYGRWGFSPAAWASDLTIATRKAGWAGGAVPGRIHLVEKDELLEVGLAIVERVRRRRPGQLSYDGYHWERQLGTLVADEHAKDLRFVRYDDEHGVPQGFAIYRLQESDAGFDDFTLVITQLVTATDDAYAALWRFALEHDLVSRVTAHLRPVDEPLPWLLANRRAVVRTVFDHLWVRILDVPAVLAARDYASTGRLVLEVDDALGFAAGRWALDVTAEGATIVPTDDPADLGVGVGELGSLSIGGVSAFDLAAAGRITERTAGALALAERLFRSSAAPYLGIWF